MAKFNPKNTPERQMEQHPDAELNYEGGLSFHTDPRTELYMQAATCLVGEQKYYESADFANEKLITAIHKILNTDPEFVLQLAVYCREQMHLRSVPLVLCAEYANIAPGTVPNARKYISRVIQRADELTELLTYQFERNGRAPRKAKLPMAIKYGVAGAFPKFDTYALGKYNRAGGVSLKDALFITHPKPKDDNQQNDWNNLVAGTLESPETWEVMRSTGKMTWSQVIHQIFNKDSKVNNYMAQLRNLRNVMKSPDVSNDDIALMCKMLSNQEAVRKSKQLPFRFLSAYRTVRYGMWTERMGNHIIVKTGDRVVSEHPMVNSVLDALEDAASISISNMPRLAGTTLIACDVSGSMFQNISGGSTVELFDIGLLFGSMAHQTCNTSITGIFGDIWEVVPMSCRSGILSNVMEMHEREGEVGYSTNGYKVIEYLLKNDIKVERIMLFTDCQMWDSYGDRQFASTFIKYQRKFPDVKLYLFDLSGYGNIIVPQDTKNVCLVAGWSDRVFDFIKMFEGTGTNAIDKIKAIKP